jgi:hypothetical protein
MPPRRRPTARLLTPAGWLGLLIMALTASGVALITALYPR